MRNTLLFIICSLLFSSSLHAQTSDYINAEDAALERIEYVLEQIVNETGDYSELSNDPLLIGPALYWALSEQDEDFAKIGIKTSFMIPKDDSGEFEELQGRTYMNENLSLFFEHDMIKGALKYISQGRIRRIRTTEHLIISSFFPFETEPYDFVVVDNEDIALVFYIVDNKIFFIDDISLYTRANETTSPDTQKQLKPTDLVGIHLLENNDVYLQNIDIQEFLSYSDQIKAAVENTFRDWQGQGFDLIVEITLFKNRDAEVIAATKPIVENDLLLPLFDEIEKIESPNTKLDPVAYRIIFQINNGSGKEYSPENGTN